MSFFCLQRWYVDGSVQCFKGAHAALAAFSLVVLLLSTALPVLITWLTFKPSEVIEINPLGYPTYCCLVHIVVTLEYIHVLFVTKSFKVK